MKTKKPPLGLYPRRYYEEARLADIADAIRRYLGAMMAIPKEWVAEYNEITEREYHEIQEETSNY
ncbi:hypothetical protein KAR91_69890 [Candidatus Pacearchaeota archaeon]|nr:hypothetical protein [Candidatus Pacearchaeota archaeon]